MFEYISVEREPVGPVVPLGPDMGLLLLMDGPDIGVMVAPLGPPGPAVGMLGEPCKSGCCCLEAGGWFITCGMPPRDWPGFELGCCDVIPTPVS